MTRFKKNIVSLSSAEFAHRVVSARIPGEDAPSKLLHYVVSPSFTLSVWPSQLIFKFGMYRQV